MALTGTDIVTKALRGPLQDLAQTNYTDNNELLDYINKALEFLSREIALYGRRLGQISASITFSGAGTFSAGLPADFLSLAVGDFAEPLVFNHSNSHALMDPAGWTEITDWQNESGIASELGTPGKFYMVGTTLYIHPRPSGASTTIEIQYYPLKSLATLGDTIPWSDMFNTVIEKWLVQSCRLRSEQAGFYQMDAADVAGFKGQTMAILLARQDSIQLRPAANYGWSR